MITKRGLIFVITNKTFNETKELLNSLKNAFMKKIILLLLIFISFASSAQDACETDFYTIKLKAFFEGFWDGTSMPSAYIEKQVLPGMQPYKETIYGYVGVETVQSPVTSNIVDWAVVCVRDKTEQVISQRGLLVLSDGRLVTYLGDECIKFFDVEKTGSYFISIHHLGHLGVMSANKLSDGDEFDFSSSPDNIMGVQQLNFDKGKYVVPVGDFNGDQIINNLDFNEWAQENSAVNKYLFHDADGNAIINNLDYNFWTKNRSKIGYEKAKLTEKDCPYCTDYEYIEP